MQQTVLIYSKTGSKFLLCTCSVSFQVERYASEDLATASENSDIDADNAPTTRAKFLFPTEQGLVDLIPDLDLTNLEQSY